MNDGGGDGVGCFDIKKWADTTELTNVERERERAVPGAYPDRPKCALG